MKPPFRIALCALIFFAQFAAHGAEPQIAISATAEVVALERQLGQASINRDRSLLEKLVSPNFVCLSPSGRVIRKAEIVDLWTAENTAMTEVKFEIENPRL